MSTETPNFEEFIMLVLDSMQASGIDYLVGGAIATWAWGEPRATQDLDVVVDIPLEGIERFSQELKKRGMLVPADIILDTIIEERADIPINAIHAKSGFKADIYPVRTGDTLRHSAFERRQLIDFGPPLGELYVHSAEDLILYKLIYYDLSRQTKHTRDIGAILRSWGDQLDHAYLNEWIQSLGLQTVWDDMKADLE